MSADTVFPPDFLYLSHFHACAPRDEDGHLSGVSSRAFNIICRYSNLISIRHLDDAYASSAEEVATQTGTRVFRQERTQFGEDAFAIDRRSLMQTIEQWSEDGGPKAVGSAVLGMLERVKETYGSERAIGYHALTEDMTLASTV